LSYLAGANFITAESGANPRDNQGDTSKNRGMDMARCRKMLFECGFDYIRRGDESKIPLDLDYLIKTDSLR
jgi:biotin synthase